MGPRGRRMVAAAALLLGLAALPAGGAGAAQVTAMLPSPAVVPAAGPIATLLLVRTAHAADRVTLKLAHRKIELLALGQATFAAVVSGTDLLDGYSPGSVNRMILGTLS